MRTEDLLTIFESELDVIDALYCQFSEKVAGSDCPKRGDITYSLEVMKGSYERIVEALRDLR